MMKAIIEEIEQMAKLNGESPENYCRQLINNAYKAATYASVNDIAMPVCIIGGYEYSFKLIEVKPANLCAACIQRNNGEGFCYMFREKPENTESCIYFDGDSDD